MSRKKMSKTEAVYQHLEKFGSITSWAAIQQYRATRLSGIIWLLRKQGVDIASVWHEKEGEPRYVIYKLIRE